MSFWVLHVLSAVTFAVALQPPLPTFQSFNQQPFQIQQLEPQQTFELQQIQPLQQNETPQQSCTLGPNYLSRQQGSTQEFDQRFANTLPEPPPEVPEVPPPVPPPCLSSASVKPENVLEKLYEMGTPREPPPVDVNNLNLVMNRVGRELHYLSEKSRECMNEKIRGLSQLKRLREGLKNAYKDIYNIQGTLAAYQNTLKDMQDYLRINKGKIVVVDNRQLGEMYGMVRRLQTAAESIVSGAMISQRKS